MFSNGNGPDKAKHNRVKFCVSPTGSACVARSALSVARGGGGGSEVRTHSPFCRALY